MASGGSKARSGGVRSLERGLALLVAMNRRKLPSVLELARDTRLPRPTVYRLLESLSSAGFVTRTAPHDRYCLTSQVRALSDGFAEDDWIADIAAPLMNQVTRQLVWPVALMTFEEGRMLVRETTHEASTLSIDHGMVGRLARSKAPEDRGAREPQRLNKMLDAIRARGYALQDREINPKTTGIAVPVRLGARVLGSLSLIWISSGLTIKQAELEFAPLMKSTADSITAAVRDRSPRQALPAGA
jgi:IclR family mhp operon transcriptional activator